MADNCCQLVGNLRLTFPGCVTSISMNSRPEIITECGGTVLYGASIGSVNINAYATTSIYTGCPSRAGVSINWIRRYQCGVEAKTYFINSGGGASYMVGSVPDAKIVYPISGRSFTNISASSNSGPASIYMSQEQKEGYGLSYTGGPLSFDTTDQDGCVFGDFGLDIGGTLYLQSFSIELSPGELPMANYSFAFAIDD